MAPFFSPRCWGGRRFVQALGRKRTFVGQPVLEKIICRFLWAEADFKDLFMLHFQTFYLAPAAWALLNSHPKSMSTGYSELLSNTDVPKIIGMDGKGRPRIFRKFSLGQWKPFKALLEHLLLEFQMWIAELTTILGGGSPMESKVRSRRNMLAF